MKSREIEAKGYMVSYTYTESSEFLSGLSRLDICIRNPDVDAVNDDSPVFTLKGQLADDMYGYIKHGNIKKRKTMLTLKGFEDDKDLDAQCTFFEFV